MRKTAQTIVVVELWFNILVNNISVMSRRCLRLCRTFTITSRSDFYHKIQIFLHIFSILSASPFILRASMVGEWADVNTKEIQYVTAYY